MRHLPSTGFTLCLLCILAAGCAGTSERPEQSAEADRIGVYESVPPGYRSYRVVRRVWTESWRSAFSVPVYGSVEAGASALQREALLLGGDAVMNFGCYRFDPEILTPTRQGLICNGKVIKYLQ